MVCSLARRPARSFACSSARYLRESVGVGVSVLRNQSSIFVVDILEKRTNRVVCYRRRRAASIVARTTTTQRVRERANSRATQPNVAAHLKRSLDNQQPLPKEDAKTTARITCNFFSRRAFKCNGQREKLSTLHERCARAFISGDECRRRRRRCEPLMPLLISPRARA